MYSLYSKNQNFLYKPNSISLAGAYFEVEKEKFYFKPYKRLLKQNSKKIKRFGGASYFLGAKLKKLNKNLTKKDLNDLSLLNDNLLYTNLKQTKLKSKNLKGYTKYCDKIYSANCFSNKGGLIPPFKVEKL